MKVRSLEKDVYNFIQWGKCITPTYLIFKFGEGEYRLHSPVIQAAYTSSGMSYELSEALRTLINNYSVLEIACGAKFYKLLGGREIKDLPIARYKIIHNSHQYQKYGYVGDRWLPAVYCSDQGVLLLVHTLFMSSGVKKEFPVEFSKNLNWCSTALKGSKKDRLSVSTYVSELLTEVYPRQWEDATKNFQLLPYSEMEVHCRNNEIEKKQRDFVKMVSHAKYKQLFNKR